MFQRQIHKLGLGLGLLYFLISAPACSLFSPVQGPVIPTPPSAVEAVSFSDLPLITDPTSSLTYAVDPEVVALMNAVSEQQLQAYIQTLANFGTRNTFSETQRDDVGIGAARRWIHSEFQRINSGALQVAFDDFPANINGLVTNQRNIIATLPGNSGHLGAIVLMAHYDSRSEDPDDGTSPAPGANDNASGVALLLELARILSSRSWSQTIIFAAFAAEEQGTYGSRHFVQDMILRGRTFDAGIDNDIVGGRPGIPRSIRVFSPGPETTESRHLARYLKLVGGLYLPDFPIDLEDQLDRVSRYSDHREFINAGVPAIRLTESEEDRSRQHSSGDTADQIDLAYLRQVAQLNLVVTANLAGAPPPLPPPRVGPMPAAEGYIVSWLPDLTSAGYAISFRPLGSPDLPLMRFVSINEAGNVAFTDLDMGMTYAVSLAPLDSNGRIGGFSSEVIVGPA